MPDVGVPELLVILVIVLVIFGAGRLTEIMGAMGKGIGEFRKGASGLAEPVTLKVEPPTVVEAPQLELPNVIEPPQVINVVTSEDAAQIDQATPLSK